MTGTNKICSVLALSLAACFAGPSNGNGNGNGNGDGGTNNGDGNRGQNTDGGATADGDTTTGGALTCPGPGHPTPNGSSCGSERWSIKVGTDSQASHIPMVAMPNTIQALGAVPANGGGSSRSSPYETTIWELKNIVLTEVKEESDSDYHLVVSDGSGHTMVVEIPWTGCDSGSPWTCFISKARSDVDAKYTVSTSPQYPAAIITVRGVGFFDIPHGQTGDAPNSIELHPVLEICFGKDCALS